MTGDSHWVPPTASRAVALQVLRHGPIERRDVAHKLGLTIGSLSRLSAPLVAAGLLREVEESGDGRVGRPSRPLDVTPEVRSRLAG